MSGYTAYTSAGAVSYVNVTYPIAFPNAAFMLIANGQGKAQYGPHNASPGIGSIGVSSHRIYLKNGSGASDYIRAHWIAMGY